MEAEAGSEDVQLLGHSVVADGSKRLLVLQRVLILAVKIRPPLQYEVANASMS